jgi:hypothetical protein
MCPNWRINSGTSSARHNHLSEQMLRRYIAAMCPNLGVARLGDSVTQKTTFFGLPKKILAAGDIQGTI